MVMDGDADKLSSNNFPLNLHEGVLALGMAEQRPNATVDYRLDQDGNRNLDKLDGMNTGMLAERFAKDPKEFLAMGRQNIMSIMRDERMPQEKREERVKRYVRAMLSLQIKLDHAAFPPTDGVEKGVPPYLPDQLSDMGKDPDPNPEHRKREKIRIDKAEIFERTLPFIEQIYTTDFGENPDMGKVKEWIAKMVAYYVYQELPLSKNPDALYENAKESIPATAVQDNKEAVCRHQAIYTQVLLQTFGITSRLMKCGLAAGRGSSIGGHACNLVRIDGHWKILDVTNPDSGEIYMPDIPDAEVDLNKPENIWRVPRKDEYGQFTYISHADMYYKIGKKE